jgi:hypothetical protein
MTENLHIAGAKADSGKATYRLLAEDFPFAIPFFFQCPSPSPDRKTDLLSFLLMLSGERHTVEDLAKTTLSYFTFQHTDCISASTDVLRVDALRSMANVAGYGARKYTPSGWRHVPEGLSRYTEAMYRHCFSLLSGEAVDPESGYPHRSHILWNCLAILQLGHATGSLKKTCVY